MLKAYSERGNSTGMGAESLKQKEKKERYEKRVDTVKPFPNSDLVQTKARLARRGRVRHVLRGTMGFSRQRHLWRWPTMLGRSAYLQPESFGARREEELSTDCEGEKIDC